MKPSVPMAKGQHTEALTSYERELKSPAVVPFPDEDSGGITSGRESRRLSPLQPSLRNMSPFEDDRAAAVDPRFMISSRLLTTPRPEFTTDSCFPEMQIQSGVNMPSTFRDTPGIVILSRDHEPNLPIGKCAGSVARERISDFVSCYPERPLQSRVTVPSLYPDPSGSCGHAGDVQVLKYAMIRKSTVTSQSIANIPPEFPVSKITLTDNPESCGQQVDLLPTREPDAVPDSSAHESLQRTCKCETTTPSDFQKQKPALLQELPAPRCTEPLLPGASKREEPPLSNGPHMPLESGAHESLLRKCETATPSECQKQILSPVQELLVGRCSERSSPRASQRGEPTLPDGPNKPLETPSRNEAVVQAPESHECKKPLATVSSQSSPVELRMELTNRVTDSHQQIDSQRKRCTISVLVQDQQPEPLKPLETSTLQSVTRTHSSESNESQTPSLKLAQTAESGLMLDGLPPAEFAETGRSLDGPSRTLERKTESDQDMYTPKKTSDRNSESNEGQGWDEPRQSSMLGLTAVSGQSLDRPSWPSDMAATINDGTTQKRSVKTDYVLSDKIEVRRSSSTHVDATDEPTTTTQERNYPSISQISELMDTRDEPQPTDESSTVSRKEQPWTRVDSKSSSVISIADPLKSPPVSSLPRYVEYTAYEYQQPEEASTNSQYEPPRYRVDSKDKRVVSIADPPKSPSGASPPRYGYTAHEYEHREKASSYSQYEPPRSRVDSIGRPVVSIADPPKSPSRAIRPRYEYTAHESKKTLPNRSAGQTANRYNSTKQPSKGPITVLDQIAEYGRKSQGPSGVQLQPATKARPRPDCDASRRVSCFDDFGRPKSSKAVAETHRILDILGNPLKKQNPGAGRNIPALPQPGQQSTPKTHDGGASRPEQKLIEMDEAPPFRTPVMKNFLPCSKSHYEKDLAGKVNWPKSPEMVSSGSHPLTAKHDLTFPREVFVVDHRNDVHRRQKEKERIERSLRKRTT